MKEVATAPKPTSELAHALSTLFYPAVAIAALIGIVKFSYNKLSGRRKKGK